MSTILQMSPELKRSFYKMVRMPVAQPGEDGDVGELGRDHVVLLFPLKQALASPRIANDSERGEDWSWFLMGQEGRRHGTITKV